jgi:hypothetical protein
MNAGAVRPGAHFAITCPSSFKHRPPIAEFKPPPHPHNS